MTESLREQIERTEFGASPFWTWKPETWEALRFLRTHAPVHWSEPDGLFVVSRFEDVSHVSKNHRIFCSGGGVLPGNPAKLGLIDEDEPRHTRLRRLINRGFTPRMVQKLEGTFREIVDETLDAVADRRECDFVDDIAVPIPLLLIAEMIGIRREDRKRFHQWSDDMILAQGNLHDPEVVVRAGRAYGEYVAYVQDLLEERRREPRDDLLSVLLHAKEEGLLRDRDDVPASPVASAMPAEEAERLHRDELLQFAVLLLVAGNETTRNALTGSMHLLIEHPDARRELLAHPEKIPAAVEELLRLTSPVVSFLRTATRDTELRGRKVEKGQQVLMLYPSANRDESVFPEPDRLDIDRHPHHLAFGIGNHFCLGANLARMELRVALAEILRRFPDMDYAEGVEGPEMAPSALVRSFRHMRVRYSPER